MTERDELTDRQAIVDLTIAYCYALDDRRFDDLDEVFIPDATADLGRRLDSRAAIKDRIRDALVPLDASQHLVATHQVRVDEDRATGRCYLQAQHVRTGADGGSLFIVAGRYDDRYVRTADGWRIEHRSLVVLWTDGNPAVLGT
jgi:3-phenylpropionate/cinnamic acid dioxygenase small subunit